MKPFEKAWIKKDISFIMVNHTGRENAIKRTDLNCAIRELSRPFLDDRKMRAIIAELRHEGFPILFATSEPAGYYLPRNLAELEEGLNKLRSYIIDECMVLRDLKIKGRLYVQSEYQEALF